MLARVLLASVLTVGLTGCGAPDDETAQPAPSVSLTPELPTDLPRLPVGKAKIRPGQKVRIPGIRVDQIVAVRGGAFYRNGTELWFTDLRRARPTGFTDVGRLVVSKDGHWLGFIDFGHGPADEFETPLAMAVAYDTRTGEARASSYQGMGDIETDDLLDLYEDGEPGILGFTETAMRVDGASGDDYELPLGDD